MTQPTPVPRLDLAPKLKRPLSLWNPLDYLRLLYWVFYFPQAFRWYVDTFGGGYIQDTEMNWRKVWKLLQENVIHRNLSLQGLLLIIFTPLVLSGILESIGISVTWIGVGFALAFGVANAMTFVVANAVAFGVAFGVANAVAFGVANSVTSGVALGLANAMALGLANGVANGVTSGVANGVAFGVAFGLAFGVAVGYVVFGFAFGVTFGVAMWGVAIGMAISVAIVRPESWLIGLFFNIRYLQKSSLLFLRITSLPIPLLSARLRKWLQQDWEMGLYNVNQLLAYTLQFIPVVKAVNQILAKTSSEQIIYRVSQLAEAPFDWKLVGFVSASLTKEINLQLIRGFLFIRYWKEPFFPPLRVETRLDTPARATAAGFWYLHEKEPAKAEEAFAVVRPILYGEEMYTLAQNLAVFHHAKDFDDIVNIKSTSPPYQGGDTEKVLRPTTWKTISSLHRVVEDAQLVKRSVSRATRSFTLNHALGELTNILNNPQTLPQAERELILDIAETWQQALLQIAGEVGEISITKPVRNPYIIGDPVMGEKFVGREELIRQLEELWVMGEQLQSVVIYGHRRMGKTSILRNAANSLGSGVKVAYVNMLNAGNISEGVGEVLMAISDAVSDALNIQPPDDDKLLKLPEITFKRYLKQVVDKLQENSLQGLIIAIDEFEIIEELIAAKKIPDNFLGYLRGLLQMNSKIAFAFAGLHTLEEMTADYFQPFFASVIPIHVGFMEPAVTRQILANPIQFSDNDVETLYITSPHATSSQEDFLLDYKPEALDKIYELTHGQPYLVQLIGFVLVRRYNDQVFELGRDRDPVFTVEDVEAIINDTDFFKRGRYYFEGVWSQAKQGAKGQQAILEVLAPHPEGLSYDSAIAEVSKKGFDQKNLEEAIKTLQRHDVVEETQGRLSIIVELFRRWLVQQM
ncbi:MAG: ATP-binding protein [Cyanobacteria bacterium P01_D01_bin.50]